MKKVLDQDGKEIGTYDGMFVIINDKKEYRIDDDGDVFRANNGYIANSGSNIEERGVGRILEGECITNEHREVLFTIV